MENKAAKSLLWVCNQIPDGLGDSNEERMLKCIKLYCKQGAETIDELEKEIERLKECYKVRAYDKLRAENKELKKKNTELKETNEIICFNMGETERQARMVNDFNGQLLIENQVLKDKNKKLLDLYGGAK